MRTAQEMQRVKWVPHAGSRTVGFTPSGGTVTYVAQSEEDAAQHGCQDVQILWDDASKPQWFALPHPQIQPE